MGVKVKIFGKEYNLKASEDERYLREIASLVDRRMKRVAQSLPDRTTEEISVLTCLNIVDELSRMRERNAQACERIRQLIRKMSEVTV